MGRSTSKARDRKCNNDKMSFQQEPAGERFPPHPPLPPYAPSRSSHEGNNVCSAFLIGCSTGFSGIIARAGRIRLGQRPFLLGQLSYRFDNSVRWPERTASVAVETRFFFCFFFFNAFDSFRPIGRSDFSMTGFFCRSSSSYIS